MTVVDYTGRAYEVGDYVFAATNSYDSVNTFIGKVCKVGNVGITVVRHLSYKNGGSFQKIVLQKPVRDMIIPEELAAIKSPELVKYNVIPPEIVHLDAAGVQYKVGDYVFVAQHRNTYFAKVVRINPYSIAVYRNSNCFWRKSPMETSVIMLPDRHLIVSEELALKMEPKLKA